MSGHFTIEQARKGAAVRARVQHENALAAYYADPNICLQCSIVIVPSPKREVWFARKKKFCTPTCWALYQRAQNINRKALGFRRPYEPHKLHLAVKGKTNRCNINMHAKKVYTNQFPIDCCELCGFAEHVDIAHIKPVRSFPDGTLLGEINPIENLIGLCPNCHWLFDNGVIAEEVIKEKVVERTNAPDHFVYCE